MPSLPFDRSVHVILRQLQSCFVYYDAATTEIYTLSLHDALPISYAAGIWTVEATVPTGRLQLLAPSIAAKAVAPRSEEHTSELQSPMYLVCRLLLEKKKQQSEKKAKPTTPREQEHKTQELPHKAA